MMFLLKEYMVFAVASSLTRNVFFRFFFTGHDTIDFAGTETWEAVFLICSDTFYRCRFTQYKSCVLYCIVCS